PLLVLAVGAVFVGGVMEPFTHWFSKFLDTAPSLTQAVGVVPGARAVALHLNWTMIAVSTAIVLAGIGLAFALYRNGGAEKAPPGMEKVFSLSRNKLYVDELYYAV